MQRASDFKVHLPITVLSTASLHAEAHFKFLPEKLTSTLIKGQR
jgi:hypothetical protein